MVIAKYKQTKVSCCIILYRAHRIWAGLLLYNIYTIIAYPFNREHHAIFIS